MDDVQVEEKVEGELEGRLHMWKKKVERGASQCIYGGG